MIYVDDHDDDTRGLNMNDCNTPIKDIGMS